jgi:ribosomal protein L15E
MIELNIRLMTRVKVIIVDQLHIYIENDSRAKLIPRADQKLRKTGRSKHEQKKKRSRRKTLMVS